MADERKKEQSEDSREQDIERAGSEGQEWFDHGGDFESGETLKARQWKTDHRLADDNTALGNIHQGIPDNKELDKDDSSFEHLVAVPQGIELPGEDLQIPEQDLPNELASLPSEPDQNSNRTAAATGEQSVPSGDDYISPDFGDLSIHEFQNADGSVVNLAQSAERGRIEATGEAESNDNSSVNTDQSVSVVETEQLLGDSVVSELVPEQPDVGDEPALEAVPEPVAAVISGEGGLVVEDELNQISGQLSIVDPDSGEAAFQSGVVAGNYGSFNLSADGSWSYQLAADQENVQGLGLGEQVFEEIEVFSIDGTSHQLSIGVEGTNDAPVISPILDDSTFSGSEEYASDRHGAKLGDDLIAVDQNSTYTLTGTARSGDGEGGGYDEGNRQYFGFTCFDADGNFISPLHVEKVVGSIDTILAVDLQPGDTEIVLENAEGWQNGGAEHQRSFAWYGYEDEKGTVYEDYSYTRNVESGLWEEGSIEGNVIHLSEPWDGPAISAGDAVRNATSGGTYNYAGLSYKPISDEWTEFEVEIGGGVAEDGINSEILFRPGTAYIKPMILTNYQEEQGNVVTWKDVEVSHNNFITGEDTVLTVNVEDILVQATDIDGDTLFVSEVSLSDDSAQYGSVDFDENGNVVFIPNESLNALDAGETQEVNLNYTIDDGHGGTAVGEKTIIVQGEEDEAVISGDTSGGVVENSSDTSVTGILDVVDADAGEAHFIAGNTEGAYGSLSINADGNWTYALTDNPKESLAEGESADEIFVVTSADGTEQEITVSIQGTNDAPVISPILDDSTFSGSAEYASDDHGAKLGDDLIAVDQDSTYTLTGTARSGDGEGGGYDEGNRQYFGFTCFDADGNFISPLHVEKVVGSTDTVLAVDLQPGDTEIVLENGDGWQNGGAEHQRSFAWYGYEDDQGTVYDDYSYTRNVENALWEEGSIEGNVIHLSEPWDGPAISAGDAVRNATSGGTYNYAGLSYKPISDEWTEFEVEIGGGVAEEGINSEILFRPGTAYIKPMILTNYQEEQGNVITWKDVEVSHNNNFSTDEDTVLTINVEDILVHATDIDGDTLSVSEVSLSGNSAQYGSVDFDENGNVVFIPNESLDVLGAGETQEVNINYTVDDGHGGTATGEETITVFGTNDAPEAAGVHLTADEDQEVVLGVENFGFQDVDGGQLAAVRVTGEIHNGSLTLNGEQVVEGQSISVDDIEAGFLVFTPAEHGSGEGLSSIDYQVSDGENWSAEVSTVNIDVTAVADAPELSVVLDEPQFVPVSGTGEIVTKTIDIENYQDADSGFTVLGRIIDEDGNLSEASIDNVGTGDGGFAPAGTNAGPDHQLGVDLEHQVSEELIIQFDNPTNEATVSIGRLFANENGSGGHEAGSYTLLNGGEVVGEGDFFTDSGNTLDLTLNGDDKAPFDQVVFTAQTTYQNGSANASDSSDYVITNVQWQAEENTDMAWEAPIQITSSLVDTDGSESLGPMLIEGVPPGAVLSAGELMSGGEPADFQATSVGIRNESPASIIFEGETAGYKNSLGYYKIDPDSGEIGDVQMLWNNASLEGSGGTLIAGESRMDLDITAGDQVGFFIVANGSSLNDYDSLGSGHYEFREQDGAEATVTASVPGLVFVGDDGHEIQINGNVYHSVADGENFSLNPDGIRHTQGDLDLENGQMTLGFEDLYGGGDRDFDDSNFTVELGQENTQVLADENAGYSTWQVEPEDLAGLTISLPSGYDAPFDLSVSAVATESTGDSDQSSVTIDVEIGADGPYLVSSEPEEAVKTFEVEGVEYSESAESSGDSDPRDLEEFVANEGNGSNALPEGLEDFASSGDTEAVEDVPSLEEQVAASEQEAQEQQDTGLEDPEVVVSDEGNGDVAGQEDMPPVV